MVLMTNPWQVFGNSNSLPISLVVSLSQTLRGLHWDQIPNDNDDEVAARGILYLLIFQQLGQLVRWSWGYHILLAPKDRYLEEAERDETGQSVIEQGQARYTDNPDQTDPDEPLIRTRSSEDLDHAHHATHSDRFRSGDQTPVSTRAYSYSKLSSAHSDCPGSDDTPSVIGPPPSGPFLARQSTEGEILQFPDVEGTAREAHEAEQTRIQRCKASLRKSRDRLGRWREEKTNALHARLPTQVQKALGSTTRGLRRFLSGLWDFMNPPLWAMLVSIIIASVPNLQHLFFDDGTFVRNSVTRAIDQNGQVAVPLILVVLGANLARNTIPEEALADMEHPRDERKLIIASLVARMLLPTIIMAPLLALMAKFVPISILDDPIFVIVCFLLTGAPSALQLAQICQINNVYVGAMSKLLFQSYVVWYVPFSCTKSKLFADWDPLIYRHANNSQSGSCPPPLCSSCVPWRSSSGLPLLRSLILCFRTNLNRGAGLTFFDLVPRLLHFNSLWTFVITLSRFGLHWRYGTGHGAVYIIL
jgi:predicted permease